MRKNNCKIIDGKALAVAHLNELKVDIINLKLQHGFAPKLCVILVGEDPASTLYVRNKLRAAQNLGVDIVLKHISGISTTSQLLTLINSCNDDASINGILVQLPLPSHINKNLIIDAINPAKDVDGFTTTNVGKLYLGRKDCLKPCTPTGVMMLIDHALDRDLSGNKAVIVGRSNLVGRPMAEMLLQRNCTVKVTHSSTKNLAEEVHWGDIVIAAAGIPGLIRAEHIKPGACVIDVGINRTEAGLVGDVIAEEICAVASALTPVPGGVGPMTVTCMLANTILATKIQLDNN